LTNETLKKKGKGEEVMVGITITNRSHLRSSDSSPTPIWLGRVWRKELSAEDRTFILRGGRLKVDLGVVQDTQLEKQR